MTYEHNGKVIVVNRGSRKEMEEQIQQGFTLCKACNRWLFGTAIDDHFDENKKNKYCT